MLIALLLRWYALRGPTPYSDEETEEQEEDRQW